MVRVGTSELGVRRRVTNLTEEELGVRDIISEVVMLKLSLQG